MLTWIWNCCRMKVKRGWESIKPTWKNAMIRQHFSKARHLFLTKRSCLLRQWLVHHNSKKIRNPNLVINLKTRSVQPSKWWSSNVNIYGVWNHWGTLIFLKRWKKKWSKLWTSLPRKGSQGRKKWRSWRIN